MSSATVDAGVPIAIIAFFVVVFLLGIGSLGVWLWGLIDAAQRPDWAYAATGSSKTVWIVLIAVLGAIPAGIYLLAIRPNVQMAQDAGVWHAPMPPPGPPAPSTFSKYCAKCGAGLASDAHFCWRCAATQ